MSDAIDYLFDEVEHHAVLRSHATLVRDARVSLAQLRAENERLKIDNDVYDKQASQMNDAMEKLIAELDEKTKAVDEARFILSQIDYWADSDWELLANAWLTAHPEKEQE